VAGERSERGEGREGAGCGVPGSTPAELVATHGGGRCGGRGKGKELGRQMWFVGSVASGRHVVLQAE